MFVALPITDRVSRASANSLATTRSASIGQGRSAGTFTRPSPLACSASTDSLGCRRPNSWIVGLSSKTVNVITGPADFRSSLSDTPRTNRTIVTIDSTISSATTAGGGPEDRWWGLRERRLIRKRYKRSVWHMIRQPQPTSYDPGVSLSRGSERVGGPRARFWIGRSPVASGAGGRTPAPPTGASVSGGSARGSSSSNASLSATLARTLGRARKEKRRMLSALLVRRGAHSSLT